MKPERKVLHNTLFFTIFFLILSGASTVFPYPVEFVDSHGDAVVIRERPLKVVSLVPGITEIICRIGAGDAVKAVTCHDTYPPETASKTIVGGFFSPSVKAITAIHPDVIFVSSLHTKVREAFGSGKCQLINLSADSIFDIYRNIELLGSIFDRRNEASKVIDEIKGELQIIERKTARVPISERKRVIRLMGRDRVMTPGDDSFQNEYIRLAGGIPPKLNKKGSIVPVTKEEWMKFNPQIIYGCGGDRETAGRFFNQPGWKDVDAVKNGKIFYFSCDLTCRASTRAGHFVSLLSSAIYEDDFSRKDAQIFNDHIFEERRLDLALDYIKDQRIAYSRINDFVNKTLIIDFKEPLSVVSTLEGKRKGVTSVGNHYSPLSCWRLTHKLGLEEARSHILDVIGKSKNTSSFLFTGADMDNLAIKRARFKEMTIYALVTAGVESNALRTSVDEGKFYEPGTINIILLPNMRLTPRAMTRAVITACEAKTAALQDCDIRSSYTHLIHQATGTGTDNIIVVEGRGATIDNAGGHTKMGELIGKAVYDAVREAMFRQNGILTGRSVFRRLIERKIFISDVISTGECECDADRSDLAVAFEEILLQSRYAGFIESAFSVSDDYERGLVNDLASFESLCNKIAEEIAGKKIENMINFIAQDNMPCVLRMALNGLLNGLYCRARERSAENL
ncbi:MAG: adenosylcobinamide amidohydrolase [Deltaproteobacteria bacterium]|nr:adenosylcobinamide amidohydrolase [Deltaproteobacteria bacterium]MBN2687800.1 adenosylcobinamide amidohydrolase [Deltaproteobacteria bacterium]